MTRSASFRRTLLIGASLTSLVLAGAVHAQSGGNLFGNRGGSSPADAATRAAQGAATQAATTSSATERAVQSFQRAAAARSAMDAAQRAARAAAQAAQSTVPNGLTAGGLQIANGVATDPTLWVGANAPTQTVGSDGRTAVTVEQTANQAILNWDSFNVGSKTDLRFTQGGTHWAVLNRVTDSQTDPTKILGTITAPGAVLIMNRNGVIFGGASQVNVRNLVAGAAAITDSQFLANGIYAQVAGNGYLPSFTAANGPVKVEAGAQITTATPAKVTDGGGYVLLMGTEVTNAGSIVTPKGQALLAAGDTFLVRAGFGTGANQYSTTRGAEVRALIGTNSTSGSVSNSGQIEAAQGDITLTGRTIAQDGVLFATTGVNQRGTIHLLASASDAASSVTIGANALTMIAPDLASTDTALDSQRDALIKQSDTANINRASTASPQFNNLSTLNDRLDQSRVEIVSGGEVTFAGGSQTSAQGGQVAVQAAAGRITVLNGALIDVSGVQGVALDMASNVIKVNVQGNELRDAPVNRDTDALKNNNVWLDIRDLVFVPAGTGGYASDRWYTRGGLLEVGGYLGNQAHGIGEWAAVGGTITLAAKEVVAAKGATFDLSGGSLDYQGGYITSTRVMDTDGRVYDISQAPAAFKMAGYGNVFTRTHDRWGEQYTQSYADMLFGSRNYSRWEDSYTVGRDAGSLQFFARTSDFQGTIAAGVINGAYQTTARSANTSDGYKLGQTQAPLAGRLTLGYYDVLTGLYVPTPSAILFADQPKSTDTQDFGHVFDTAALRSFGLGGINISSKSINIAGDLTLAHGGLLDLAAQGDIQVSANATASAGRVTMTADGSITVDKGITVSTRGLWTNQLTNPLDRAGLAYLTGGSISLSATKLTLGAGSLLDASAGGAILPTGQTHGGNGGDISLRATGSMALDGKFASYGFGKGGKLTIATSGPISIGGALYEGGVVPAGQPFALDIKLAKDAVFPAGSTLPFDIAVSTPAVYLPGETVSGPLRWNGGWNSETVVIGTGGWTVPDGVVLKYSDDNTGNETFYRAGEILPAGTPINFIFGSTAGFVVPASAFPNGFPQEPSAVTVAAGSPIPISYTVQAGSVIRKGTIFNRPMPVEVGPEIADARSFFQQGFSAYNISSSSGVIVKPGTTIEVTQPVFQFTAASLSAPTGSDAALVAPVVLPPQFLPDPVRGTLIQRAGADLVIGNPNATDETPAAISKSTVNLPQGDFLLGAGASIRVDPGRSVSVGGVGQIDILGSITARGGSITLVNTARTEDVTLSTPYVESTRSVLIGGSARLDVSGLAVTAPDTQGRNYGVVTAGGSVALGALDATPTASGLHSGNAFVVVSRGAVIDASGASGAFDMSSPSGSAARLVASDGGRIALASQWGISNDGTLLAPAGGVGASGGSLVYTLETPPIGVDSDPTTRLPDEARKARVITVSQTYNPDVALHGALDPSPKLGEARIGVDQINAGGFGSLSLWARGGIAFDGDVTLAMSRSLTLRQGPLMNSSATGRVTLSAPYVLLDGLTVLSDSKIIDRGLMEYDPNEGADYPVGSTLTITGDLVDIRNRVRTSYGDTNIVSGGDLRLLAATGPVFKDAGAVLPTSDRVTVLGASNNLTLTAAQIYPASGARAIAAAGVTQTDWQGQLTYSSVGSVLTIRRSGETPAMPYLVFGSLGLFGDTIHQGGVVRAPFGAITVGSSGYAGRVQSSRVELLAGSITSVSTNGLLMPYGGSTDGVNYLVDGVAATFANAAGAFKLKDGTLTKIGVTLGGRQQSVDAGAVVDVSGGGQLTGAAFISGRGGSVDILQTSLANANPANGNSAANNAVYAILPGVVTAPVAAGYSAAWTGAMPGIGQQISVPAGVPGLSAGTYTLLPANYALLPGAFRVELAAQTTTRPAHVTSLTNGSTSAPVYQGIASTSIRNALPTQAIFTPATAVRRYAQYQEQGYSDFARAQAAQFKTPRSMIEADAHLFTAHVRSTAEDAANGAFSFGGQANFSAGSGGLSGAFVLTQELGIYDNANMDMVITGDGSQTINSANVTTISAAAINAVQAPNLVIGSNIFSRLDSTDRTLSITGFARSLTLQPDVHLIADSVFLGAKTTVTLAEGATVNTLGRGFSWLDATSGLQLGGVNGGVILGVSNGTSQIGMSPDYFTHGSVVMKQGSGLYAENTVAFAAADGLAMQGDVGLAARRLSLTAASLNIGTNETLAAASGVLPPGMNLTQVFLDKLLAGGSAAGSPAVQQLTLGAANSINFFGSVTLNTIDPATGKSRVDALSLSSPTISGYGNSADTARIVTDTLIWQGSSARPGARIAELGNAGAFAVDARQIVFGDPSGTAPVSGAKYNRLMLGFDQVSFSASQRVTANGSGTLSVYGTGPAVTGTFDPTTYRGSGNSLTFRTPVLTADSGATFGVYSNAVSVIAPDGSAPAAPGSLGGTLSLTGDTLTVASAILLPSGRLSLTARGGDLVLTDAARLDVAGHPIAFNDVRRQAWAGDILLTSLTGDVVTAKGATIDLSSEGSDAGTLTVKAGGAARLAGTMTAKGGEGARSGAFDLTANTLTGDLTADFAALNQALNANGFSHSRAFTFGSGSLVVGNDAVARNVSIAVNGGGLTLSGLIDASGTQTGSIRLSARDDVTLAASAVLDAHGTKLVVDSYGKPIDASNRSSVEITSQQGWVRLGAGATINTSSPDKIARGRVDINARRTSETGGDIQIDASGALTLRDIASLAVNGYWTYSPTDANGTIVQDAAATGVPAGAVGLAQVDAANQIFYANALANTGLRSRLAGLSALNGAYHLRPGVEIASGAASNGKLTVLGDLDLSGYRYGPDTDRNANSATYGFGEPLALAIRASGNLDIKGSITDGFGLPKASPDDSGFRDRPLQTTITPQPISSFIVADYGDTSYDSEAGAWSWDYYGYTIKKPIKLSEDWLLDPNYFWGDDIADRNGVHYYGGDIIPAGTVFDTDADYGYPLIFQPDQVVPAFTYDAVVKAPQGKIYAIAPMLAPGAMSASIRLVGGADLASADMRGLRSTAALAGSGTMTLDDYHIHAPTGADDDTWTSQISSVIRTGTGDLDVLAGGAMVTKSLFGIYTAGTQNELASGNGDFATQLPRDLVSGKALPGSLDSTLNSRISYYPEHGGDLQILVHGDYTGYHFDSANSEGNWLILQGANELGQKTAWSVNYGKYNGADSSGLFVDGPNGFGTFGGGNATVRIGGDAGGITPYNFSNKTGLIVTVAATGRVLGDGTLIETGGGNLDIKIGGALNAVQNGGAITNLRGKVGLDAAQIGSLTKVNQSVTIGDPRMASPTEASLLYNRVSGPDLKLGDTAVTVRTRGDLALGSIADPGVDPTRKLTGDVAGAANGLSIASWFSLMRPSTSLDLTSLGADIAPLAGGTYLPSIFRVAAASGSLYLMTATNGNQFGFSLEQAPSPLAQFELLARNSIYSTRVSLSMSSVDPTLLPTPFHPAYVEWKQGTFAGEVQSTNTLTVYDVSNEVYNPTFGLFALSPNVATTDLHAGDPDPVRVYAVNGDIVGLQLSTAKRLDMRAAKDIVANASTGFAGGLPTKISVLHADSTDVSLVRAGHDIIYSDVKIAGPGTLAMTAGHNITLADQGNILSTGPAYAADLRPGASISVLAGTGSAGPDYAAVAALYLNPSNLAVAGKPLADQPGKVAKTYQDELTAWLKGRYGYATRDTAEARAYFGALPPEQQAVFLQQVYFAELKAGGREYNNPTSSRFGSYLRGREMIATLFPSNHTYEGDVTFFATGAVTRDQFGNIQDSRRGGGILTVGGGDISVLTPGGRQLIGVEGVAPPAASGFITQGSGDINLYSSGSILLGLSRIMTTFGGSILGWSATGDINAGRGAKTTLVYTPPRRVYDPYGNVALSPQVPSSGAGIATLAPIAEVPSGDVDLIAPLGTIDAGEAGIRVSGNVNLAALQVVNAANIQVKGNSAGIPQVPVVNVGALAAASSAASAVTQEATRVAERTRPQVRTEVPVIINVRLLGFGEQP